MSEKTKNKKGLIIGIVAVIVVVAVALGLIFGLRKNEEASAIMQLETNPSVQLILDDDTIIGEVAINEDGEEMLALVSFVGLKVEVAAEKFALVLIMPIRSTICFKSINIQLLSYYIFYQYSEIRYIYGTIPNLVLLNEMFSNIKYYCKKRPFVL